MHALHNLHYLSVLKQCGLSQSVPPPIDVGEHQEIRSGIANFDCKGHEVNTFMIIKTSM